MFYIASDAQTLRSNFLSQRCAHVSIHFVGLVSSESARTIIFGKRKRLHKRFISNDNWYLFPFAPVRWTRTKITRKYFRLERVEDLDSLHLCARIYHNWIWYQDFIHISFFLCHSQSNLNEHSFYKFYEIPVEHRTAQKKKTVFLFCFFVFRNFTFGNAKKH